MIKVKVFVVDESEEVRYTARRILEDLDFQVECFRGKEVIGRLSNANDGLPAVIFLAAGASRYVHGEGGVSLLKEIRRIDRRVIIIATSGWPGIAEEMTEADSGRRTYIRLKPYAFLETPKGETLENFLIKIARENNDQALISHLYGQKTAV